MKRNILSIAAFFVVSFSFAQGEMDALRYARNDLTGTARAMSMGGAFGALGGDITGIAINPGGIGVYRSSEIVTTMNFENISTKTTLTDNRFKFNFDNVGYVGFFPSGSDGVVGYHFGFTYNRLKNYNRKYTTQGQAMPVSLSDYVATKSRGLDSDLLLHSGAADPFNDMPWLSVLSYNAGIIKNKVNDRFNYESILPIGETVDNALSVSEKGSIGSYDFTLGMNIANIVSLGATLSFTNIDYRMSAYYSEKFANGGDFFLDNWLQTDGNGCGVKVGTVIRPIDALRIGIAYHSPTWYSLYDHFNAKMDYSEKNWIKSADDNTLDYSFQTPYKWVFSVAGIIGTRAIVSVDYELTDYSSTKFHTINGGYDPNFKVQNSYMEEDLRPTSSLRTGLEIRPISQLSIRLGYAFAQAPMKKRVLAGDQEIETVGSIPHFVLEGDTHYYTAGLGFRFTRNLYMDVAVIAKQEKDKVYAFSNIFENGAPIVESTPAGLKINTFKGLLTVGCKF
ncbi:MAG: outer membrane protein transport protein [Dysgonamonadaceae bacterium]|jgi:hypothetical protein|nr:outer membrane protein transport protein [Dysgonamonadaceae bacterium]